MAEHIIRSSSSLSSSANRSIVHCSLIPGLKLRDQRKSYFLRSSGKFGHCSCDRNGFQLPAPKVSSQFRFTDYRVRCNGLRIVRSSHRTWIRHRKNNHTHVIRRSVCNSTLKDFLGINANLSVEESSKQRDKNRQVEFLSLCAQVMLAAQVAHMPLLPFLYKNWPGIVDHLNGTVGSTVLLDNKSGGSGVLNTFIHKETQKSFDSSLLLRITSMGLGIFVIASLAFKFSPGIGPLLDLGILSCILYSLVFLATSFVKVITATLRVTIKGELLSGLGKWFNLIWLSVTRPIAKIISANSFMKPSSSDSINKMLRKQQKTSKYNSFLFSFLQNITRR